MHGPVTITGCSDGILRIDIGHNPSTHAITVLCKPNQPKYEWEFLVDSVIDCINNPGSSDGRKIPLIMKGTPIQNEVWEALRSIPFAETRTYKQVAEIIGRPKSARPVAQACSLNPFAVVVPCHRVIRTDGQLAGYKWGHQLKDEILRREAALHDPRFAM